MLRIFETYFASNVCPAALPSFTTSLGDAVTGCWRMNSLFETEVLLTAWGFAAAVAFFAVAGFGAASFVSGLGCAVLT
jgi:hypothetical protein